MSEAEPSSRENLGGRASISAVAKKAGVSIATVSRVVNGVKNKASPATVEKVKAAIAELGYRPSGAGQALRKRESRLVAVIAANLANPSMSGIAASAEMALREAGYVMVLCDSHDRPDLQDEYLREMRAQMVSAFVLLGAVDSPVLNELLDAGETVLFVNRHHPSGQPVSFVGIDNGEAGCQVARQIHEWHAKKVLVIHGSISSSAVRERVDAFCETSRGLDGKTEITVKGSELADHLTIGYDAMNEWLNAQSELPDCVFCLSDLIAFGASRALRDHGYRPSQDCRLIGFDDNPLNDWVAPWLTSMRVPYEEFGDAIVDSLKQIWAEPQKIETLLEHKLVLRS